jgi:hypothetical protein
MAASPCTAVGGHRGKTLVESWNGGHTQAPHVINQTGPGHPITDDHGAAAPDQTAWALVGLSS